MNSKVYTTRQLVREVEQSFEDNDLCYGHGTDNPHDEAVYLVFCLLGIPFDCAEGVLDELVKMESVSRVFELAGQRICDRIPVAYLVNQAWFCGLEFQVDRRVLIPRSPIAELIENRFSPWVTESGVSRVLDIGTGSGCIAVACAIAFPKARIDAVDVSDSALELAEINVDRHRLSDRIRLLRSDLFEKLQDQKYDLIIANPPYVSKQEMDSLPPEYCHEPALALEAGSDGLDIIRRLLSESGRYLRAGGILVVEAGNGRQAIEESFPDLPLTWVDFEFGGEGVFLLEAQYLQTPGRDN
ncbi:MAG: ribosomal protein L3 N(5)-glutamine methyltransferase [Gammaproteobacteria bacterium RIFCSPLOWO2_02_FULL_56_15]|nr:MAG: ribosomal protein L3 N(5)-glutamine methyltransferase [Gammaproteobacteria bacterium RIFCSPLOWO2_02_FULL_56_15]